MEEEYPSEQVFTKDELSHILDSTIGKTLLEVDKCNVFDRTRNNPKITGIAGDVIERSVLGYMSNNKNTPDILVDGVATEVKVTGVKYKIEKGGEGHYVAKEPMTITAVSVETLGSQVFEKSTFHDKIDSLLIVYYHYLYKGKVLAADYADFPIVGYEFHRFTDEEMRKLRNDWTIIHDFIKDINENSEDPKKEYPRLSSELRGVLLCLDTAPKWPNKPRFRFKRSFLTGIVKDHFDVRRGMEELSLESFDSYGDLEGLCKRVSDMYRGRTISELASEFGIKIGSNSIKKDVGSSLVVKMMGGDVRRMKDLSVLDKVGVIPFTIVLNPNGRSTEATKLMRIDFDEFLDEGLVFQESYIYDYFLNNSFLAVVFEETEKGVLRSSRFLGFKKLVFSTNFIKKHVRRTWKDVRRTVRCGNLCESVVRKADGTIRYTKSGVPSTSINFPKARSHDVFLRGSGSNAKYKTEEVCGIRMYRQNIWIRGPVMVEFLDSVRFL